VKTCERLFTPCQEKKEREEKKPSLAVWAATCWVCGGGWVGGVKAVSETSLLKCRFLRHRDKATSGKGDCALILLLIVCP